MRKTELLSNTWSWLFCSFCKRLGHLAEDCIELFIITHPRMHIPQPVQLAPMDFMPDPHDNYSEEERYNVDLDEPDSDWSDWSLEVYPPTPRPSHVSSDQEQSAISSSEGDQAFAGYNQNGFDSYMSLDSDGTHSYEYHSWHSARSLSSDPADAEHLNLQGCIQVPERASPLRHLSPRSPTNFITSDIDPDFEVVSDADSSSPNLLSGHGYKRWNPEHQNYLHSSGICSSSATHISRKVSPEDLEQWRSLYKPCKRIKSAATDHISTSISKIDNLKSNSSNTSTSNNQ